ncbi:MAG: HAD family phosphatase [Peptococcaceae bacterium]|nr:HAD family phosphatase [Peptococcaceae bacterium]
MTIKLAVFDIDGTLAKTEECIPSPISERVRAFENSGLQIVLISGRTASYLAGLARGMGINKPLVAGENGGVIFNPLNLWEKRLDIIPPQVIEEIKTILSREFGDLWFQPNQTMLTAAPKDLSRIEELHEIIRNLRQVNDYRYKINKYNDAVEIMPKENSKGKALAVMKDILDIQSDEVIVFGNTVVDLSMKAETKEFLFIGDSLKCEGMKNYPCIEDALAFLEKSLTQSLTL